MNIKEKAQKVYNDVQGDKKEFYLRMIRETSELTLEEAEVFMTLLPRSGFNSVDRYWREFAPKEKKDYVKENIVHKEFSQAEKNRMSLQAKWDAKIKEIEESSELTIF